MWLSLALAVPAVSTAQTLAWRTVSVQGADGTTSQIAWRPSLPLGTGLYPSYLLATATMEQTPAGIPRVSTDPNLGVVGDRMGVLGADLVSGSSSGRWGIEVHSPYLTDPGRLEGVLPAGREVRVAPQLSWQYDALRAARQVTPTTVRWRLLFDGRPVDEITYTMRMQDFGDVPYAVMADDVPVRQGWLFAAFIDETNPVVDTLLREALDSRVVDRFTGYMSGPQAVTQQVFAIWHVLQRRGFRYSNITTPSAPTNGVFAQHVRTIGDALATSQANCVDGTLLMASALRRIGIDPVLVWVPGHMYLGYRLQPGSIETAFLETTLMGNAQVDRLPQANTLSGGIAALFGQQNATQASAQSFNGATYHAQQAFVSHQAMFSQPESGYSIIDVRTVREQMGLLSVGRPAPRMLTAMVAPPSAPFDRPVGVSVEPGRNLTPPRTAIAPPSAHDAIAWKDASVRVGSLGWQSKAFEVPRDGCRVRGTVTGLKGGKKDVEVRIATNDQYHTWGENDLSQPDALRSYDRGALTEVDLLLERVGRHYVVISNQFSVLTPKTVAVDLRIECE
ncbi:MAG: hypothetical protein AB7N73_10060 [Gemmatimonadales bacterium]